MSKIAIVTDTNSGITFKEAEELGIHLIPMPFFINGAVFFEDVSLSQADFFKQLTPEADISTSQPSIGTITDLWDKLLETHDAVIYIPMSSGLSGTCHTAKMLANDYEGKVFVADNKRISVPMRQSVLDALALRSQNLSASEITALLEKEGLNASIYITVDTLTYLKKGGRITPAAATIGSILNIKPVLQIQGDKLDAYRKVRGKRQAMDVMIKAVEEDMRTRFNGHEVYIEVAYSGALEDAEHWIKKVKEHFPQYDIYAAPLPLSIACHIGAGALGIGCVKKIIQ